MIKAAVRSRLGQFQLTASLEGSGVTCVAGKNGVGKTSLMKALAGFLRIDEGYVTVGGVNVTHLPPEKRNVVMVTPTSFFPHLDVDSHLTWGARLKGSYVRREEVSRVKSELGIDFGGKVRSLSLGMRERVALATALLASPKGILVDEAFASLYGRDDFIVSYGRLVRDANIDLIFTSQSEEDGKLAERLYIMNNGMTGLAL